MATVLKTLIQAKHLPFLSPSLKSAIDHIPTLNQTANNWIQTPYPFLDQIHPSWLSVKEESLYRLTKNPNPRTANFAKRRLWNHLKPSNLQPLCLVETDILSPILKCTKLTTLLHHLGLFDLALDLKKTVQSDILKAVQNALTPKQIDFLKPLAKKSSDVDFGPLDLVRWDRESASLQNVLYRRGMNRLAKSLAQTSESFIWYFSRKNERDVMERMQELMGPLKNTEVTRTLINEVLFTLEAI